MLIGCGVGKVVSSTGSERMSESLTVTVSVSSVEEVATEIWIETVTWICWMKAGDNNIENFLLILKGYKTH